MSDHDAETKTQLEIRLKCTEDLMLMAKLYAEYWMAQATTGATKSRKVFKGGLGGERLTAEELIIDALATAEQHLKNFRELAETRLSIMNKLGGM